MPLYREDEYNQLKSWFREQAASLHNDDGQAVVDAFDHGTPRSAWMTLDELRQNKKLPPSWDERIATYYEIVF